MVLGKHENKHAIGIFATREATERALRDLQAANFPMERVSVVAKDDRQGDIAGVDPDKPEGSKAGEGAKAGALTGGIGGAIIGALEALGFATFVPLLIPGGQILAFGAVAANVLANAVAGGAIGAIGGGILGGLIGWGVPEDRAKLYQDRVGRGEYLVMLEGDADEIASAEAVLHSRGIQEWGVYQAPRERVLR